MSGKLLVWLAVAALLILAGRCSVPSPTQPSADSTRIMRVVDTVVAADTTLQKAYRAAQKALGTANGALAYLRSHPPIPTPQPAPDDTPRIDSLFRRIAADSVTLDTLGSALSVVRDSLSGLLDSLPKVSKALRAATNRLRINANLIGALQRRRSYPWSAGILLEGTTPVGGYVSRDVWRGRVSVEVTGPEAVVRIGVGVRF